MIDRERRKKLALHLRHLAVGLITNNEFESRVMRDVSYGWLPEQYQRAKEAKTDDFAIVAILALCWHLYNDTKEHKLTGKYKLSDKQLEDVARFILFLHSNLKYEWIDTNPKQSLSFKERLLNVLTLGRYCRNRKRKFQQELKDDRKAGDDAYFPFFRKEDYEAQLKKQPFLSGHRP